MTVAERLEICLTAIENIQATIENINTATITRADLLIKIFKIELLVTKALKQLEKE